MKNKDKWIIMTPGGNTLKEKQTVPEKTIVIDIKLTRGLIVALSCVLVVVALFAYLTLTGEHAAAAETETAGVASPAQSTGMRQFYLTKLIIATDYSITACEPGYHFASIWEIADPSNLKYNTSLGYTSPDSGQGPPSNYVEGWVRTGYNNSSTSTSVPGYANCDGWTSNSSSLNGTVASLPAIWTGLEDVGVWLVDMAPCSPGERVWCIED